MDMKPATPTEVSKDQTYGGAVVNTTTPTTTIIINQPAPIVTEGTEPHLVLNPDLFKMKSITIKCPYCKNTINTKVRLSFSFKSCCLCVIACWGIFACFQACRYKDVCCCDADHYCTVCGRKLGSYVAC